MTDRPNSHPSQQPSPPPIHPPSELLARADRFWPGVALTAVSILVIGWLRLFAFPDQFVPLADALPLLIALWHRSRPLLWVLTGSLCAMIVFKMLWIFPRGEINPGTHVLFAGMLLVSVAVPAAVVHAVLVLAERLEGTIRTVERVNAELETSNEELAAREAEIGQQNEELQSQAVELEQQVEEMNAQAEELQSLNEQLAERERTLGDLLAPSVTGGTEQEVLVYLSKKIVRLLGERAAGAILTEPRGSALVVVPLFGVNDGPYETPGNATLSELVMSRDRACLLGDASLRADLDFPRLSSDRPVGR